MFRLPFTRKETVVQATGQIPVVGVILERQRAQIWGRVEQNGMMAIVSGSSTEVIAKKMQAQLNEFSSYMGTEYHEPSVLPLEFTFTYHYDLTRIRELFQQFRIANLAEQTAIPQDVLNQFMTNKQYPSSRQARQIELFIQKFGQEILNFSLL